MFNFVFYKANIVIFFKQGLFYELVLRTEPRWSKVVEHNEIDRYTTN
jgi:hypothetical protein